MSISIVIPTYNESGYIGTLLDSVERQEFDDYEIIVCDGGSEDNTLEIVEEHDVKIVHDDGGGPGKARNKGAEHASGDILLFLDADVKLENEHVLTKVTDRINVENVIAGTSSWIPFDGSLKGKILLGIGSRLLKTMNDTGVGNVAVGNFLFIDKDVFDRINGFDASLPFNEDHKLMEQASSHGKTVTLDRQFYVSVRRVDEKGVLGTLNDYIPPSIYYFLGKEETMKEKFRFETVG